MAIDLDFLNPNYKPALLAFSAEDAAAACKDVLRELNFKVLVATSHDDFLARFDNIQFQLVIIEDTFLANSDEGNRSLRALQRMPMTQRRHAIIILLGHQFETLHPLQAFAQSVHAVVNWADFGNVSPIIQQLISDQNLFLNVYREAQMRVLPGKS